MSFRMAILLISDLMSEMVGKGGRSVRESGYTNRYSANRNEGCARAEYRDGVVKALIEL